MKKLIYVAAPYTHPDPVANTHKAIQVAEELVERGFMPLIPHLLLLWHIVSPHKEDFWYECGRELLRRCDGLLRIEGESKGADWEVELAKEWGIPVYYSISEVSHEHKETLRAGR